MNAKILLIAFSAAAFTSCSTAYKSGQTPDDVYYSPVRAVDERKNDDRRQDDTRTYENTTDNNRIRMAIRDRRWRDFDDYDYSYNYSPYYYCTCSCNNYGYYYNPYYYIRPVYSPIVIPARLVNSTPRMVNLNSYKNYGTAITNPKTGATTFVGNTRQYNNSNNGSRLGNILRQVFPANPNSNNSTNSTPYNNNNTRSYTPSSSNSSSGSSSGGSSSGGSSVSRPGRG